MGNSGSTLKFTETPLAATNPGAHSDAPAGHRLVLGIGVFDGMHPGHNSIIAETGRLAASCGAVPAAMTFDPHPRAILRPEDAPMLLLPLSERIRLLQEAGAGQVLVTPFTHDFSRLEPERFLDELLDTPDFRLAGICVGENWRFGRDAAGDVQTLRRYAERHGLLFAACPVLTRGDRAVSSSEIRRAVASGRLDEAAAMLGRPYRLYGAVEHGFRDATEILDRPTANLRIDAGILPPDGVYAAGVHTCDGVRLPAIANIGVSPTFRRRDAGRRLEVHLLDFTGNLYGCELGVEFMQYLREERTFPDPGALKRQIEADVAQVRHYFNSDPTSLPERSK